MNDQIDKKRTENEMKNYMFNIEPDDAIDLDKKKKIVSMHSYIGTICQ